MHSSNEAGSAVIGAATLARTPIDASLVATPDGATPDVEATTVDSTSIPEKTGDTGTANSPASKPPAVIEIEPTSPKTAGSAVQRPTPRPAPTKPIPTDKKSGRDGTVNPFATKPTQKP
jgi:hypothetical protein